MPRLRVTAIRAAVASAIALAVLAPGGVAVAAPGGAPARTAPAADGDAGSANDGAGDGLVTFGLTTASDDRPDDRGYLSFEAPPGAEVYDHVAVVNFSDAPLDVDVYTSDATNSEDGTLVLPPRSQEPSLAGTWVTLGSPTVHLPAQGDGSGPGMEIVPVTISIPADAEPGDHVGAVVSSVTAHGQAGEKTPALDLEQRTGLRVYVTVQGQIRPGLTVSGVRARFIPNGVFGPGKVEVTYTLTNSGNVRFGIEPSVRGTGPFGLAPRTAEGRTIAELLPHAAVRQTVTLDDVWPFAIETVTVSARAVAALGRDDPGLGTVTASSWTWVLSWLYLVLVVLVGAAVAWFLQRRRSRRPGTWGPPKDLWGSGAHPSDPPPGDRGPAEREPAHRAEPGHEREPARGHEPEPAHGPPREPVR